jgi:hypothetical protein
MMHLARQLAVSALLLAGLAGEGRASDAPDAVAVPGACFVLANPNDKGRLIDRIELQQVQTHAKAGKPLEPARVRIGMQPKGGDDLMPSDLSAPCAASGTRLACTLRCEEQGQSREHGRFRVEPQGPNALRLTIETPLVLNACTPGETPVALPASLAGKSFLLRRAGASDCFH